MKAAPSPIPIPIPIPCQCYPWSKSLSLRLRGENSRHKDYESQDIKETKARDWNGFVKTSTVALYTVVHDRLL
jgi:hypothetical protein